ncbi:DNA phosphorothioation-associated putative methyltransferase [Massilia sp. H6]|uniref:DNA phosphorothioation-associated putative methyltransferase n=1 Tax=Massilia sp. H6 TaxID=2970464 RepID=UPI00216963F8|nr:DNA phosphorothioation-associated putative methyltransferase [Massilia sp. H6]UVW30697.1 DNA phosphorothioation-associated putative methyltransferase [Massilia sp. H6]
MQKPFQGLVGKHVVDHLYAHITALSSWPEALRAACERAASLAGLVIGEHVNVVKMHASTEQLSLLAYDDFDAAPFPTLSKSWRVHLQTSSVVFRDYTQSRNPPVLHRKETLLPSTDPRIAQWSALTHTAEALGLFEDTSRIGFHEQWLEQIASKGYALDGEEFIPLANVAAPHDEASAITGPVQRHLTALTRTNLSAPVQALWRHELINFEHSFFDYGCGKGDDLRALLENGIEAAGWDPHYRPEAARQVADTVNLGFVINVIEDLDERMEALRGAYALTRGVLAVAAMLASAQPPDGRAHRDGYLTSRNTFQKYFSQVQLRDFIEHVLDEPAVAVGPGVFFVFRDKLLEQRFLQRRYGGRRRDAARAWRTPVRTPRPSRIAEPRAPKPSREEALVAAHGELLRDLWQVHLGLGRAPLSDELTPALSDGLGIAALSLNKALSLVAKYLDQAEVRSAEQAKVDDLLVFAALGQFGKRQPYRDLDPTLQRDVRYHFGDYRAWQCNARAILHELTDLERLNAACVTASQYGLGWLVESHSLQLHTSLVPRLPALLRIYIGCATMLVGELSDFDLVKIHIRSGKMSLSSYVDFDNSPIPALSRRVKVKLRELDLDLFEYGSEAYPSPCLFWKSRFINEECLNYADQLAFEDQLVRADLNELINEDRTTAQFAAELESRRWQIDGFALVRSANLPELDKACGGHFTYRDFIERGETQASTGLPNRPRQPATYTALHDLARQVIDPVVDYFGMVELTYGFCSAELARVIPGRIAPKLDQHAGHELTRTGRPICDRLGAACDFVVADEDMEEVALWVAANTPFDRLYFYGKDRPIHVSYSATPARQFVRMTTNASGMRVPRIDRSVAVFSTAPIDAEGA